MRLLIGYEPRDYPSAAAFRALGRCDFKRYDDAYLRARLHLYDVVVPHLGVYIGRPLLMRARRCRLIATPTTGRDHFDLRAAEELGIEVLSLNEDMDFLRGITSTAELAWLLILACARRLPQALARVARERSWNNTDLRGRQLSSMTLGIVGYGRLGRMVERYARAFGMHVLVHDRRHVRPRFARAVSLKRLLAACDIVSLHAKWLPPQPPVIDARALALMKPGAILVNTARGGLVDSAAVLAALRRGRLSAVGMDVANAEYQDGRLPKDPLVAAACHRDDILVTPHIGGATLDAHGIVFAHLAKLAAKRLRGLKEQP